VGGHVADTPAGAQRRRLPLRLSELVEHFTPAQAGVFQRDAPDGSRLTDLAEQPHFTEQPAGFLVDLRIQRSTGPVAAGRLVLLRRATDTEARGGTPAADQVDRGHARAGNAGGLHVCRASPSLWRSSRRPAV